MQVVHIMPRHLTHLIDNRTMALCLAQFVLSDDEYAEYYAEYASRGETWLIMDNGLAEEGKPLNPDQLLEAAKLVHPQEIVLPDYIEPDRNVKAATATMEHEPFMRFVNDYGIHLMYVPHGRSVSEWMDNLTAAPQFFDSIGISKFHDRIHPQSAVYGRGPLGLLARGLFPETPLHYLGLGLPPAELQFMAFGRSCDTGVAAMYGLSNIRLSHFGTLFRPERLEYVHEATCSTRHEAVIVRNMGALDQIARNGGAHQWLNG